VDLTASLEAPHPPEAVFPWVAELDRYPAWLDIVPRAVRVELPDGDDTWLVWLRARLGPLARSKRLRMRRVALEVPRSVRFERAEDDGRDHSAWVLDAAVEPTEAGSRLTVRLHYDGGLLGPVVERLLADEIERSRERLLACLATDAA
jgi:carbon monoxide dehydrogenase subunit G